MKIHLILLILASLLPSSAWPEDKLFVQVPAVYDPQAPGSQKIKDECAIDALVGNHVFAAVNRRLPDSVVLKNLADAGDGKVLQLTVLSFVGLSGGGWSGSKSISIRADLMQGGKVLRSSVHQDHSRGGMLGSAASTCYIFETVAKSLGRKVAAWIVKPTEGVERTEPKAPSMDGADKTENEKAGN